MEEEAEQNVTIIVIKSLFLCLFIVCAVVGNASVIHVVRTHAKLKTVPNMFVLNLAIADILFALTGMPMILVTTIAKGWVLGSFLCNLGGFLNTFTCTTSIWTLVFISINRYVAVAKANDLKTIYTRKRSLIMIFSIWFFSATISIPPVFGWSEFIAGSNFCTINGKKSMSYAVLVLALDYFIPFFLMVGLYLAIFILLRRHEKTMSKSKLKGQKSISTTVHDTSSITSDNESHSDVKDYAITREISSADKKVLALYVNTKIDENDVTITSENDDTATYSDEKDSVFDTPQTPENAKSYTPKSPKSIRIVLSHDNTENNNTGKSLNKKRRSTRISSVKRFFKERRVTKMLLIVVLGFFLCWTTFLIASILYAFDAAPENFELLTLGIMLACLNSVINPIIYALMNQNFRNAFRKLYLDIKIMICYCNGY